MKLRLLILLCSIWIYDGFAQDIPEPEFVGEVLMYSKNQNCVYTLPKERCQQKTRANASLYLLGAGRVKTKLVLDNPTSIRQVPNDDDVFFIVRVADNSVDPLSMIQIFQFKQTERNRNAELSSLGTFDGWSENNKDYVSFFAKKYGESSYLLRLPGMVVGEYGIIVNYSDDAKKIVATFGIWDKVGVELAQKYAEKQERLEAAKLQQKEAEKQAKKDKKQAKKQSRD